MTEGITRTGKSPRRKVGRPRAGGEDKSARILQEALDLFSRVGYDGATLDEIAKASDLSKTGLLHHFPSKEALFAAVLEERDRRLTAATDWHPADLVEPWELLELWSEVLRDNVENPAGTSLYVTLSSSVTNPDHPARAWFKGHLDMILETFTSAFEYGKELGTVAADAPSRQMARILVAVSDGLQLQFFSHATEREDQRADLALSTNTDIVSEVKLTIQMLADRWGATPQES